MTIPDSLIQTHPGIWQIPALAAFRANVLARQFEDINTGWEDTLIPLGLVLAGRAFADQAMIEWARGWSTYHLGVEPQSPSTDEFRLQRSGEQLRGLYLTPYCGEWGSAMVFAELHEHQADDDLLRAVRLLADHIIDGSIRVGDGVIAHGHWSQIPWVDTLYYSSAPLARAYRLTGEDRYAQHAVEQCLLHAQYLRDDLSGCFFHEAHIDTGERTSWLWARGNGWVIMALADTLRDCPPDTPGWTEVLRIYREMVVGLLRLQHPSGLWRIVPENEEAHLETSGAIMIATGLTVGLTEGYINATLAANVLRTWWEVLTWITPDGRLMGCQTPAGAGGWETHKRSVMGERTYGTGSLLRLAAEMRKGGLL
jgi:rhamnogalacturonyl hydrolase YesR